MPWSESFRSGGFSDNDISVLFPDKGSTRDFAHKKATKMPEGGTVGASTGGVVGGKIGLLAGIGALAIPGLGPLSQQDLLWQRQRQSHWCRESANLPVRWSDWASPSTCYEGKVKVVRRKSLAVGRKVRPSRSWL
jgi:hypothetical protein